MSCAPPRSSAPPTSNGSRAHRRASSAARRSTGSTTPRVADLSTCTTPPGSAAACPPPHGEQRGAALDRLDDATRARLLEVNAAYRERHGFPLVIAVRGHTVDSLIAFAASRVENATDAELATGVEQVARI